MHNRLSQHQRFLNKMALTPQMRQSIKILGMSTKDLNEYIDTVLEANPFLEKVMSEKKRDFKKTSHSFKNLPPSREQLSKPNPRQSLLLQLRLLELSEKTLEIAEYLLYEMDDNGYIASDLEEAADTLGVSPDEVEECLSLIQSLNPPGIGARNLTECLELQLKSAGKENSLEYKIVTGLMPELAKNDIEKIAKKLNTTKEKTNKAIKNIKKLNPRPAGTLLSDESERIIPDLIATVKKGKIWLELNNDWLPKLRLYNPYEDKFDVIKDPAIKKFLRENESSARYYIDGLRRREETMCKVASFILNYQKESISEGSHKTKPLTIKDVSKALKLHPSTINRTVSNKYIQIEDRVALLKNFLSHAVKKENGEITSKKAVKKRIEEILKNEEKTRPYRDKDLQELLLKENICLKRRTIAKYRTSLKILPSHLRRKITPE